MKHISLVVSLAVGGALLGPHIASSQMKEAAVGGVARSAASQRPGNLCARSDRVVLSCALHGGKKSVSLCASGDGRQGRRRFYYAYGHPSTPELIFPSGDEEARDVFARTPLIFAGNTGGYAYSFVNKNYKYIMYLISGSRDYLNAGLVVQKIDDMRITGESQCQKETVNESHDDDIFNEILAWKKDDDIYSNGLPRKR